MKVIVNSTRNSALTSTNLKMCILVYNLESYEFFCMDICRCLCHSFNFVNMIFVVMVIFFPIKSYGKIYCHSKILEFCYFFFFSHIFPWMNKFLFTENKYLPCSINRKVTVPRVLSSKLFKP